MALKFGQSKGGAIKDRPENFEASEGENRLRLVGDILARYVYWIKGENNKSIPFECLDFDREEEKFLKKEKNWVPEYYPELKCGWAYVMQCIDLKTGELKVYNLKKKLFGQIKDAAEDLGDPTDPVNGWDVVFKKEKTGPLPINVEYKLQVLRCKNRPLNEQETEIVNNMKPIDEIFPRPTPDEQQKLLDKLQKGSSENIDEDISDEFDVKE